MKNSKLKDEFEKVNESSGTSPHRYGKSAFDKTKKRKCNKSLYWLGGIIGAAIIWHCCQSEKSNKSLLSLLGCDKKRCAS